MQYKTAISETYCHLPPLTTKQLQYFNDFVIPYASPSQKKGSTFPAAWDQIIRNVDVKIRFRAICPRHGQRSHGARCRCSMSGTSYPRWPMMIWLLMGSSYCHAKNHMARHHWTELSKHDSCLQNGICAYCIHSNYKHNGISRIKTFFKETWAMFTSLVTLSWSVNRDPHKGLL